MLRRGKRWSASNTFILNERAKNIVEPLCPLKKPPTKFRPRSLVFEVSSVVLHNPTSFLRSKRQPYHLGWAEPAIDEQLVLS
jgi:hypothetical protein